MAHDLEQLKQDHPDVAKLFADDWLQYRKSEILPELTRLSVRAQSSPTTFPPIPSLWAIRAM